MADQQQEYPEKGELFTYLVSTFYSSAFMQMGKMANPVTNKVEKDMEQAQFSIDLLDMLKEKTQGNLTEEESKLLDRAIKELKMNYMEEMKKAKKEAAGEESESGEQKEEQAGGQSAGKDSNIVTPDEAFGGKDKDDDDSGKDSSNIWTP